jgi:chromosome segregation ATPase
MSAEALSAIEAKIEELQEDIQFLRVEVQSQGEQIQELKTSRDAEGVKSKAAKKTDPKLLVSRWIN